MHIEVTETIFMDAFTKAGRGGNFTYEALKTMFSYFEEIEECTEQPMNLDVISICCDYTEFNSIDKFNEAQGTGYKTLDEIQDNHSIIVIDEAKGQFVWSNE